MKVRIAFAPAALGHLALIAGALALVPGGSVLAQTPAPPAAKAQPKAPAQPKTAPAPAPGGTAAAPGAAEIPPLTYTPWTKVCVKNQEAGGQGAQQVCFTGKDGRLDNGMLAVGATLIEPEGAPNKMLRITLPLGVQLAPGTRLIVDQGQPLNAPFTMCFPNGCIADYEVSSELLGKLRKGQNMVVQGIMGQLVSLPLPLSDFGKAYDGPPTDPKVIEERQRKLQEEFQKKQEQLQQQQAAPK